MVQVRTIHSWGIFGAPPLVISKMKFQGVFRLFLQRFLVRATTMGSVAAAAMQSNVEIRHHFADCKTIMLKFFYSWVSGEHYYA